ncbi:MAG: T9SS type A sorting domain-containing protein, partial [Bacteroidales bacterium]|nr:T9SS type A sorting domain-containing protein [Bacteroidales bacterium]
MVTKVYPNPVRNTLFIESGQQIDYLRMFDLAGRVVYQAEVMDNQTTIDANLLGGGLYILQMVSGQQVKTHKIQVVK